MPDETLQLTLTGDGELLERIKRLLTVMEWTGMVGHSASYGTYVDGDGADRLRVEGFDKEPYKDIPEWVGSADMVIAGDNELRRAILQEVATSKATAELLTEKALENNVQNLIVSRIHRAYTVACDELFGRGYLSQDERKAIGGQVGEMLGTFINSFDPSVATRIVAPQDVEAVVETKETTEKQTGLLERLAETFMNLITSTKAGARHSTSDRQDIQTVHDIAVKQGAECQFEVKEVDGALRWVLFSSSAYKDRDGEIVSVKAHEADIARLDAAGDYGVLRWWHIGEPEVGEKGNWQSYKAGRGVDLGVCDFAAMQGRIRVESGTFYDPAVGRAFKEVQDQLNVSLGFAHPADEPDASGVFENVHTFERSLLPKGTESNRFVDVPLILSEKERQMEDAKKAKLKELIGPAADGVLAQASTTDKEAEALGVKFKEIEKPAEAAAEAAPASEAAESTQADPKVGDMTLAALKDYIGQCLAAYDAAKSTKEAGAFTAFKDTVTGKMNETIEAVNGWGRRLKALEGDLPRSMIHELRAINDKDNVVEKKEGTGPQADPVAATLDAFLAPAGSNGAAHVGGTPPTPA